MLNLYTNPYSTFATKVLYFVEETGRPYNLHVVDLGKGEQAAAEFRRLNFAAKVPAIELDGFAMGESSAIMRYLAEKWQLEAWYPRNLEDRARVDQLADYIHQHVSHHLSMLTWHLHFAKQFGRASNSALVTQAQSSLQLSLPKLEAWLQGRNYLCAAQPTLADVMFLPFLSQHDLAQVSLAELPNLHGWLHRMAERAAWQRTQAIIAKQLGR